MCLPVITYHPELEIEQDTYQGYEYVIASNFIGHRCGYVKLQPGHPWYGVDRCDDIKADVHGGITFSEPDVACGKGGDDNGWWIGFDCGGCYDAIDPELLPRGLTAPRKMDHQTIRTTDFVRLNIHYLITQAISEKQQETLSRNSQADLLI